MVITIKFPDGTVSSWSFRYANDINKLVKALAENIDGAWATIEISIHTLGPALRNNS